MDLEDIFVKLIIVLGLLAVVILLTFLPFMLRADKLCLEAGHPESKVTWDYQTYCVREVDATEYVVPLDEVIGE